MPQVSAGSFTASLLVLKKKGLRYGAAIDIGCADGTFFLTHHPSGIFTGTTLVNIDVNPLYEPSLRRIRDALGGHYLIAAVAEEPGEVTLTAGAHPYWSSLVPQDDPYWRRINHPAGAAVEAVTAVTIDGVARDLALAAPLLIKMDIQGAEPMALRGARKVLEQTAVVICEADMDHFQDVNTILTAAGFDLFDVTNLNRIEDHTLGWFYPVYLHRRFKHLLSPGYWNDAANAGVLANQANRRRDLLALHDKLLSEIDRNKTR